MDGHENGLQQECAGSDVISLDGLGGLLLIIWPLQSIHICELYLPKDVVGSGHCVLHLVELVSSLIKFNLPQTFCEHLL